MESTQELGWLPMLQRFQTFCSARNLSPHTIRAYRADLAGLADFVGLDANASQIDRFRIRAFLVHLREADLLPLVGR